jgi:hypothetical protein
VVSLHSVQSPEGEVHLKEGLPSAVAQGHFALRRRCVMVNSGLGRGCAISPKLQSACLPVQGFGLVAAEPREDQMECHPPACHWSG